MSRKLLEQFLIDFNQSTVIQGLVTMALVMTMCYLALRSVTIPQEIFNATMLTVGFWFGSKTGERAARRLLELEKESGRTLHGATD